MGKLPLEKGLIDVATTFSSEFFPEVKEILSEFTRFYQPIEDLEIWDLISKGELPKKLYEDCFHYPDKAFYWKYEKEGPIPTTPAGRAGAAMNEFLLSFLAKKCPGKIDNNTLMGWAAKRAKFKHVELWSRFRKDLKDTFLKMGVAVTGSFYYPPGGYREWHTNADKAAGWRMYYVRVSEEGKSWFHYINPTTDQLVQVPDKDDHFHLFYLTDLEQVKTGTRPEFFWHNVVSHTHRRSLGFRVSDEMVQRILNRIG